MGAKTDMHTYIHIYRQNILNWWWGAGVAVGYSLSRCVVWMTRWNLWQPAVYSSPGYILKRGKSRMRTLKMAASPSRGTRWLRKVTCAQLTSKYHPRIPLGGALALPRPQPAQGSRWQWQVGSTNPATFSSTDFHLPFQRTNIQVLWETLKQTISGT